MNEKTLQQRITALNENSRFQLVGRVAAVLGTPLIIAGGIWSLTLLTNMSKDVAVMKSQLDAATADPYHGADARRDFALYANMIHNNSDRLDGFGKRLDTLEYAASRRQ